MANYHFIGGDGKSYGPYSAEQMREFMAQNRLAPTSQVRVDAGPLQPASSFPEICGGGPGPAPIQPTQPGQPMPQYAATSHLQPDRGTLILVLGILSLIVCGLLGIPAWVMGNKDLKEIDAGRMNPAGRSNTNTGRICGMITTILTGVCLGGYLLIILIAVLGGAAA